MHFDEDVVGWAKNFIREFMSTNSIVPIHLSPSQAPMAKWCCPEFGFFNVNTDAAITGSSNRIGLGIMVQNHDGLVMVSSIQSIMACFSPQVAEATALLHGIRFVIDASLLPALVESDAKSVVDLVKAGLAPQSDIGTIISEILLISISFPISLSLFLDKRIWLPIVWPNSLFALLKFIFGLSFVLPTSRRSYMERLQFCSSEATFWHQLLSLMKKALTFCCNSESKISAINKQDLEIRRRTKILDIYIEDVDKMLNGLETLQLTSLSHDGLQVVRARIEELKKDQQNVKDRFTEFTQELGTSIESFQESKARLMSLQKEEQDVKVRLTNLMIEGWCVVDMNGSEMVIEVSKKKEEHENERFKKEESKVGMMMSSEDEMEVLSDLSDIDTNIEGLKEDMLSTLFDIKNGVIKNRSFWKEPFDRLAKSSMWRIR
ncbi:hypothetical protein Dsin_020224 [Dipteronia sinensis]|uniref:RNase H type-1 domain-containing protein n=1 Tax=Dipteronia sinensis TaxID=43782 RepID=A0AAE0AA19_9ROSI|nr:hypothetical protein Dsin_020224 [Dipteronia sinensis]